MFEVMRVYRHTTVCALRDQLSILHQQSQIAQLATRNSGTKKEIRAESTPNCAMSQSI